VASSIRGQQKKVGAERRSAGKDKDGILVTRRYSNQRCDEKEIGTGAKKRAEGSLTRGGGSAGKNLEWFLYSRISSKKKKKNTDNVFEVVWVTGRILFPYSSRPSVGCSHLVDVSTKTKTVLEYRGEGNELLLMVQAKGKAEQWVPQRKKKKLQGEEKLHVLAANGAKRGARGGGKGKRN